MKKSHKYIYLTIVGALTCTALTGFYWQGSKYLRVSKRWELINTELSQDKPTELSVLEQQPESNVYPFKYVGSDSARVDNNKYVLISRPRDTRLGYMVFRKLLFQKESSDGQTLENGTMVCLDGWIPDHLAKQPSQFTPQSSADQKKRIRGILRKGQAVDYMNKSFSKEVIQSSGIKSYIDLQYLGQALDVANNWVSKEYYVQIFDEEAQHKENVYPVKHGKRDFDLPYLTPGKHRDYATFWGTTSLVGLFAIFKVLRM